MKYNKKKSSEFFSLIITFLCALNFYSFFYIIEKKNVALSWMVTFLKLFLKEKFIDFF